MSDTKDVEILFKIRDEMTSQIGAINKALSEVNETTKKTTKTATDSEKAWKSLSSSMLGLVSFGAVTFAFKQMVDVGSAFEKQMSNIRAVVRPTTSEFDALKNKAMELGAKTAFSASQAAEAFSEMGKLGFQANQIIASSGDVLALAAAGQVELSESAKITVQTLNQFGLAATDAARVTDVIAQASNVSALDVRTFADAMKYAGTGAKLSNTSLEETTALLAIMHDRGMEGSMAGTAINEVFTRLSGAYKNVNTQLKELGVENGSVTEKLKAMAAAGYSQADMFRLFGDQGARAFGVIAPNIAQLDELANSLENARGAAKEMARVQQDNFKGASDNLSSSLENLGIVIFDSFGTSAKDAVNQLSNSVVGLADDLKSNPEVIGNITKAMIGMVKVIADVVIFLTKNADTLSLAAIVTGAYLLVPALGSASTAMAIFTATMSINPIVAAAVAVTALAVAVNSYSDSVSKTADNRASWFEDSKNIEEAKNNLVALKTRYQEYLAMGPAGNVAFSNPMNEDKGVKSSQKGLMSATGSTSMYQALGVGADEFRQKWGNDIAWTQSQLDRAIKNMDERLSNRPAAAATATGAVSGGAGTGRNVPGRGAGQDAGQDAGQKAVDAVLKEVERVNTETLKMNNSARDYELKAAEDKWSKLLSGLQKGSDAYKNGYRSFQQEIVNIGKEYDSKDAAARETARKEELDGLQKIADAQTAARDMVTEAGRSQRENEIEGIKGKWAKQLEVADSGSQLQYDIVAARDEELARTSTKYAEEDAKKEDEQKQIKKDRMSDYLSSFMSVSDSISQVSNAVLDNRINNIDKETAAEKDKINTSKMSEKEKQKALAAIEKEAEKRKFEAAMKDWRLQMIMSIANTALGVTKTIATTGFPAAIPLLIAQGVASAVAIGTLVASKPQMADGGVVAGENWGDRTSVGLNGGELVMNTPQQRVIAEALGGKRGGGSNQSVSFGAPIINISGNADTTTVKKISGALTDWRDSVLEALYSASARGEIDYTKLQLSGA